MKQILIAFITLLPLLISPSLEAKTFDNWKNNFRTRALNQKISPVFLDTVLNKLTFLDFVVQLDKNQPERLLSFEDYISKVINLSRIQKGKEILKSEDVFLKKITQKYGIPAEVLVAFWGLETNYGRIKGHIDIGSALATLSYEGRREKFFTKELLTYLQMLEKENSSGITGSWAGAFGHFQFMPSTYASYAVDGNNDGKIDLVNNKIDAFHSAANYLSKMGWKRGYRWGRRVNLPAHFDYRALPKSMTLSLKDWQDKGFLKTVSFSKKELDMKATLLFPNGYGNKTYLVYKNFFVIKRWNNSNYYALAVGFLSDAFKKETSLSSFKNNFSKKGYNFKKEDVILLQTYLKKHLFYKGKIDGIFGSLTRKAILRFYKKTGRPAEWILALKKADKKGNI